MDLSQVMEWMHISGGVVAHCMCDESLWIERLHCQISQLDIKQCAIAFEAVLVTFLTKMTSLLS